MNPPFWLVVCVIAGSLAGSFARAQSAPPQGGIQPGVFSDLSAPDAASARITLAAAVDAAWARAVSAREHSGQLRLSDAARAASNSAWSAPPSLQLNHRNDRLQDHAGKRETELSVSLPLWLPGQQGARVDLAEAERLRARAAEQVARLRLAGEVREAAWQLAMAETEAAQAEALASTHRQLADDVARRVQAGDLARTDGLAAQAEYSAAVAQQVQLQQQAASARAHWTLLTGSKHSPELAAPAAEPPAAGGGSAHPELTLSLRSAELAQLRIALLRYSRRDAPELTLGIRREEPARHLAAEDSLLIGMRLPLASDARNHPLEIAAHNAWDTAQTEVERTRERIDSDIGIASQAYRRATQQFEHERSRARLLRERAALIDKSFHVGETPLPELLRALAAAAHAEAASTRARAVLGLVGARLEQALGVLP